MYRLRTLHPEKEYTQLANFALDDLPNLESLGLLAHILRHDDDWNFRLDKLVEQKSGVTRRTASKARATLIRHGYLIPVKFRIDYRGRFATDLWRSAYPHTDEDVVELGRRYQPGSITQIPVLDGKKAKRDTHGRVLLHQVTVTWGQVESFRGVELVQVDGSLRPKDVPEPPSEA
jgi:hypothetical protein